MITLGDKDMSSTSEHTVEARDVENTVRIMREDGATKIVITKNSDSTFDVTATFPD